MEEPWQVELGRNGIARVAVAQDFIARRRYERVALAGNAGVARASLNHEVLDDAVEECAVIEAFAAQLDEIVAMAGCLVAKLYADNAGGSL